MTEWWTYRLSDLLMFSAATYRRLFEMHNASLWPLQLVTLAAGAGLVLHLLRGPSRHDARVARWACAAFGLMWIGVAWTFHIERYAPVNWSAHGFAVGFVAQGSGLLVAALCGPRWHLGLARGRCAVPGLSLLLLALVGQPALDLLLGRPWLQAQVFGLAPDPTVLGTLALLLLLRRSGGPQRHPAPRPMPGNLWVLPLLWCLISGATLWTLGAAEAPLLPAAALLVLCCRVWVARTGVL